MDVQVIYSEGDQALLDMAKKTLKDYEESLMLRIKQDGMNWAATEQEIRSAFISDPTRIALNDVIVKAYEVMIPVKTIYPCPKPNPNAPARIGRR